MSDKIREKQVEIIEKLEEYIKFLSQEIGDHATYLMIHNINPLPERIEKGKRLREEISLLKLESKLSALLEAEKQEYSLNNGETTSIYSVEKQEPEEKAATTGYCVCLDDSSSKQEKKKFDVTEMRKCADGE